MFPQSTFTENFKPAAWFMLMILFASDGMCQTDPEAETEPASPSAPDEIVVYGKQNSIQLRFGVYKARKKFFEKHNEVNSNDEFDYVCKTRVPLGSGPAYQTCTPKFILKLLARVGRIDTLGAPKWHLNRMREKQKLLEKEMIVLVNEDPELLEAFAEFKKATVLLKESSE